VHPALLVLAGARVPGHLHAAQADEALLVAVPSTLGPCRTGQYHVFYDRLFDELASTTSRCSSPRRIVVRRARAEFKRDLWRGIVLSDSFTDVRTGIRLCALDVGEGLTVFERV